MEKRYPRYPEEIIMNGELKKQQQQIIRLDNSIVREVNFNEIVKKEIASKKKERERKANEQFPEISGFWSIFTDNNESFANGEYKNKAMAMALTTSDVQEISTQSFIKSLAKLENWANRAIENNLKNSETEINDIKKDLSEKDMTIEEQERLINALNDEINTLNDNLTKKESFLTDIQSQKDFLEKRHQESEKILAELEAKLAKTEIDWNELNQNKKQSITSTEHFLSDNLKALSDKYERLQEKSLTNKELLEIKGNELREYVKLANKFATEELALNEEITNLRAKLSTYSNKIIELEVGKQLSESKVISMEFRISKLYTDFGNEKIAKEDAEQRLALLQNEFRERGEWELDVNAKADARIKNNEDLNAKNKAIYNKTALENARQSDTIIDLKDSLEKNKEEITNLNNTINGKNNKIIILEKDLQHENRKKKVSTLTNFVRWIGSWFLSEANQARLDTSLTGATSYYVLDKADHWTYEFFWLGIGISLVFFLKWLFRKLGFTRKKDKEKVVVENHFYNQPQKKEPQETLTERNYSQPILLADAVFEENIQNTLIKPRRKGLTTVNRNSRKKLSP